MVEVVTDFDKYPDAPALIALIAYMSSGCVLKTITATFLNYFFMVRSAVIPLTSAKSIDIKTISVFDFFR